MALEMIARTVKNQVEFKYVLFDAWFSSVENIRVIKQTQHKEVICPIKSNRKVALSLADQKGGQRASCFNACKRRKHRVGNLSRRIGISGKVNQTSLHKRRCDKRYFVSNFKWDNTYLFPNNHHLSKTMEKWKFTINHWNKMLVWQSLQRTRKRRKQIIFTPLYADISNWRCWK